MAVHPVGTLQDVTQQFCILGNLTPDRCFHRFNTRQGMCNRTDTTNTRCDLRDLIHRLADGELLDTPHWGDAQPVATLDDAFIVDLQNEL